MSSVGTFARILTCLVATRETADSALDLDFVQAELFVDLGTDGADYRTGFRFDARLRGGDRPGQIGVNWTNPSHYLVS